MKDKYFNEWEQRSITRIAKENPIEGKKRFKQYLKKYPTDYLSWCQYANTLIVLGNINEAERIINKIEQEALNTYINLNSPNKIEMFMERITVLKIKILSYSNRYVELYDLYNKNQKNISKYNLFLVPFYCSKHFGTLTESVKQYNDSYLFQQLIDYSDLEFLKHLRKHLADNTEELEEYSDALFKPGFPILDVILETRKYIPSDKKMLTGYFDNKYVFKYNECGRNGKVICDFFEIVTFDNTKNYITMYPIIKGEKLPHIDLNYMIEKKEEPKIKRMSQIDKFKQKYKL